MNPKLLEPAAALTSVFRSGNSQAVRIPKEFQFSQDRVTIFRRGADIVLRPQTMTAADALAGLPVMSLKDALAFDAAMADRHDLLPLEERGLDAPEELRKTGSARAADRPKRKAKAPSA